MVDLLKGFGILTVVAGHCNFPMLLWVDPYSFHMPLFFFISGFFLNLERPYLSFVRQKANSLLVPFYKYCIAFVFIACGFHFSEIPIFRAYQFNNLFTFNNFCIEPFVQSYQFLLIRPLWFVTTLFLAMILVGLCRPILVWAGVKPVRSMFLFLILIVLAEFISSVSPNYSDLEGTQISQDSLYNLKSL